MKHLPALLKMDFRLQVRYGFLYAALFVVLVWVSLMRALPREVLGAAVTFLVFADLGAVGLAFIAGQVLFEKGERTLYAMMIAPVTFAEYLASKLLSLTALAWVITIMVVTASYGPGYNLFMLTAGTIPMSVISLLVGLIAVSPYTSVSNFIVVIPLYVFVLVLPLLEYFGWVRSPLMYLAPTRGSLVLLRGAFGGAAGWEAAGAVVHQAVWIAVLLYLASARFERYVIARGGGGAI
ncbi:MAG: fluoroquinolone transporter permease [Firmicutes bacterium]|jgi:fluoroquinolone transport system permease protein|nr:fluoroquinolone transporter permease [Bacillota bacterium]